MTIKEVEQQTGLARSNIRFYEKENLISPSRNTANGYRDYSEKDVNTIKKIAYLRTLGISIENIKDMTEGKTTLREVAEKQKYVLDEQISEFKKAHIMCEKMLSEEDISYEKLEVEKYVPGLDDYWKENPRTFKMDAVSFLYIWGSFITWLIMVCLCLGIGILVYHKLPGEIPIQWSGDAASSVVDKKFIFAYPAICIVLRYLLRPVLYVKLKMNNYYTDIITEYLTNYLCFIALSVEVFSILFIWGAVKSIVVVLFVDTAVFIGILIIGIIKMERGALSHI